MATRELDRGSSEVAYEPQGAPLTSLLLPALSHLIKVHNLPKQHRLLGTHEAVRDISLSNHNLGHDCQSLTSSDYDQSDTWDHESLFIIHLTCRSFFAIRIVWKVGILFWP